MLYTYNDTDRVFYRAVWDVLVVEAGASKNPTDKELFVRAYTQVEHPASEYRFCGSLGFGGKFWRNDGCFYVSCYPEDRTPSRMATLERVNAKLRELQESMRPNPLNPEAP